MALQMNLAVPKYNTTLTNCYWKIDPFNGIRGGKDKLWYEVKCYKTKADADLNQNNYETVWFEFVPSVLMLHQISLNSVILMQNQDHILQQQ
jgi:hypothetical protein